MLLMKVLLELLRVLLGANGNVGVLVGEDSHDAGSDFAMDNRSLRLRYRS
jgi:hypothetical protein